MALVGKSEPACVRHNLHWWTRRGKENHVSIVDVKMPFMSMVVFMVKAAIAAIPAMIILAIVGSIIVAIFGGLFGGIGR